ncbi:hypothetical protein QL104_05000 [Pseudomonas piscis]|uniref:DUF4440 domain-containing protein n=1 Tax=Pseudomonas piscis TaxID=2614538 RepID=A0ABY9NMS9_9PSED|nr:hypothetical protein [Pseudomonas piscis]WMN18767.1 hypothetical protein QL104_05000 [Pseudomonas piscis]
MIALDAVRKEWQNSFRIGNIELLSYIESDSFIAIVDMRIESKSQRLDKIDRQMRMGRWIEVGLVYSEIKEIYTEGSSTSFQGLANTYLAGRLLRQSSFKEIWKIEKGRWRIVKLICTTII